MPVAFRKRDCLRRAVTAKFLWLFAALTVLFPALIGGQPTSICYSRGDTMVGSIYESWLPANAKFDEAVFTDNRNRFEKIEYCMTPNLADPTLFRSFRLFSTSSSGSEIVQTYGVYDPV